MHAFFKLAPVHNHIVCNIIMLHRPQYSYAVFIYHIHLPLTLLHSHLSVLILLLITILNIQ